MSRRLDGGSTGEGSYGAGQERRRRLGRRRSGNRAEAPALPAPGAGMTERDWLAEEFEQYRPHLRRVAYQMLGTLDESEDAVQEAWLRLNRVDGGAIENLAGWLTTVVARVCLDVLRARRAS